MTRLFNFSGVLGLSGFWGFGVKERLSLLNMDNNFNKYAHMGIAGAAVGSALKYAGVYKLRDRWAKESNAKK